MILGDLFIVEQLLDLDLGILFLASDAFFRRRSLEDFVFGQGLH